MIRQTPFLRLRAKLNQPISPYIAYATHTQLPIIRSKYILRCFYTFNPILQQQQSSQQTPINISQNTEPIIKADNPIYKENKPTEPTEAPATTPEDDTLCSIFEGMEPYMDTYSVYTKLTAAGFTPTQADKVISLLICQLNSKLSKLPSKYSQNYELENEQYLFESAQQELRVDITRSREQHIHELIELINVLERDFSTITDELNSDFIQMRNDAQVAINDQKSENTLNSKGMFLRIQETNHKITTELNSAMRSEIESLRWYLSRWGIITIMISIFASCTTFYISRSNSAKAEARSDFAPLMIYEPSEYEDEEDSDDYNA
ncbi:uncharacterized protein SPAPADRAFT_60528 [Spathaspora passalidarum NRRL Y-27907]|uniref:DUF1640 domain-containing protein n=1 Tax=Spathaspora passalidarum (strain NRRL Y-27907 / 11-Y1) TaxID=619300 RepID=G3ALF5_SPAPN|nr:uncharacterized protein SPAPADRAFT_60528 [Spathaspora passalidarum NRRL Y-27907]EGW33198.1 hypothetical protein SPAPADRAFT_60528 [Spathaspora passalidarum NRRL Y-27907]